MHIKIAIRNKVYDIWRKADPVVSYELADYDRPEEEDAYLWLEWENLLKQLPALQYEIIRNHLEAGISCFNCKTISCEPSVCQSGTKKSAGLFV